jgi:hypothetical protein
MTNDEPQESSTLEASEGTPAIGYRVRFDDKSTSWLVRAVSDDGRYTLLTCAHFGEVAYTIIDWRQGVRGAMDVLGGGMGIDTLSGPDENIDEAMDMLAGRGEFHNGNYWGVSRRNRVSLRISSVRSSPDSAVGGLV